MLSEILATVRALHIVIAELPPFIGPRQQASFRVEFTLQMFPHLQRKPHRCFFEVVSAISWPMLFMGASFLPATLTDAVTVDPCPVQPSIGPPR